MGEPGFTPIQQPTPGFTPIETDGANQGLGPVNRPTAPPTALGSLSRFGSALGGDLKGLFTPRGQNPYPGLGQDEKAAAAGEAYQQDQSRKAANYPTYYRAAVPFGESLGFNVTGMEDSAAKSDMAGVLGHLAAPPAAALAVKGGATAASDIRGLADPLAWKEGLNEMSHQMLDKSANQAKRTLWDTRQKVSENVGNLINQISAKDAAKSPNGSINVSDLLPKVEEIANAYKAQDGRLPNFDKIAGRVSQQNPNVSWYELHKLKTEVGKAGIAASDPADAAAVSQIEKAIDEKLTYRANDLGASTQNAAYKKQWSTLKSYEDKGVLGDLLGAKSGKDFFDILNDPKKSGPLGNMVKDLSNFGLPEDFRTKLRTDHQAIYDYTNASQKSGFGKFRAVMQHPIAGTAGFLGGRAAGAAVGSPFLGGAVGAVGAGSMVDRVMAAKNIRALGGPAPIEGEMGDLGKVKGEPTEPPTSTRSPILKDVTDALVSQGMKKADAAQAAQRGVSQFPDDFDKAFSTALRRPDNVPPQSKVEKIAAVKSDPSQAQSAFSSFMDKAARRVTQEAAGQDVLDQMSDRGESPRELTKRFWNETYFKLPAEVQAKFRNYLTKETSFKPGDTIGFTKDKSPIVARDWADIAENILDVSDKPEDLEGTTRGLVALMRMAEERVKSPPTKAGKILDAKQSQK